MKEKCPYEECGRTLSTSYSLKRHIDTCHFNLRKFPCSYCTKKFSSQRNLWAHLSKHSLLLRQQTYESEVESAPPALLAVPVGRGGGGDFLEGVVVLPPITPTYMKGYKLPLAWQLFSPEASLSQALFPINYY